MLAIPLRFEPRSWDGESEHLEVDSSGPRTTVVWTRVGLKVAHTGEAIWPKHEDLLANSVDLRFHGRFGFSLGRYHEFLLNPIPSYAAFRFGSVEVTFGEPSPMMVYMFDAHRDEHYHGEWEHLTTVRIFACDQEEAELVLVNSLTRYEERFKVLPTMAELSDIEWSEEEADDDDEDAVVDFPNQIAGDVEPLRCMYYAKTSAEPASACIQYYRVLEYYAFFSLSQKLNFLRRDSSVSDRDFFLEAAQLLTRDEKGPIVRLIAAVATTDVLDLATAKGLIPRADGNLLGSAAYDFRNSVVHAKSDQRVPITVDPIVSPPTSTNAWRTVLLRLAEDTLASYATRRIVGGT